MIKPSTMLNISSSKSDVGVISARAETIEFFGSGSRALSKQGDVLILWLLHGFSGLHFVRLAAGLFYQTAAIR